MLRRVEKILYRAERVEFESAYSLDVSVARLNSARSSALAAVAKQAATGKVSPSRVVLQRSIPFVGNSFKPFFVGRFEERNGRVILTGQFTMHWLVKAFMTFWLGFCALWTILAVSAVVTKPEAWFFSLAGVAMFAAGVGFVRLGQWFARNDEVWLSELIRGALANDGT